jgi:hypothetical protein
MNNGTITVSGQQVGLNLRGGAVNAKGSLVGVRAFCAIKAGIGLDDIEKMSFKEVKALIVERKLATGEQIKTWGQEYDTARDAHKRDSRSMVSLFVASPEWKHSFKPSFNAKGDCIGGTATFRKETSSKSLASQLSAARAQIAALEAKLALPAVS